MAIIMWHGAQRWEAPPEIRAPRKGQYEAGVGFYLTTSYDRARRYAKGGGSTVRVELANDLRFADEVQIPIATVEEFLATGLGPKGRTLVVEDVRACASRIRPDHVLAQVLVNLYVNHEVGSGKAGLALTRFLVSQGVTACRHQPSSGEEWIVVMDPAVILSAKRTAAADVSPDEYRLPTYAAQRHADLEPSVVEQPADEGDLVEVTNILSGKIQVLRGPIDFAVMTAYGQAQGNHDASTYADLYGLRLGMDEEVVGIGDFIARRPPAVVDLDTIEGPVEIQVFDVDSGMGGRHTVQIVEDRGDVVDVVVRYGRPTPSGWHPWREWDGAALTVPKDALRNERMQPLYRGVVFVRDGNTVDVVGTPAARIEQRTP